MTQYPSPYQPQQPYGYDAYDPYGALKAPARRASILMFVFGGLLCACGMCCAAMAPVLQNAQLDAEQIAQFEQMETQLGMSMQALLIGMGIAGALPGIVFVILGFFVRGGSMGAVITALVIVSIAALTLLALTVSGLVEAATTRSPDALWGMVIFAILLACVGLLMALLIQAVRKAGELRTLQAQYQMQYWQYQQQQQAYQQQQHHWRQDQPQEQRPPQQDWPPPPPPPPAT